MKTIDIDELAGILRIKASTIRADLSRRPERLPPRLAIPGGGRPLWLESTVSRWLKKCEVKR